MIVLALDVEDPRVLAADRPDLEDDVAVGIPPEHGDPALQREELARIQPFQRPQNRHRTKSQANRGPSFHADRRSIDPASNAPARAPGANSRPPDPTPSTPTAVPLDAEPPGPIS